MRIARIVGVVALTLCLLAPSPADASDGSGGSAVASMTKDALIDLLVTGDPTNASIEALNDHLPEALERFKRAHETEPKNPRWACGVALVKHRMGEHKEGHTWAKKAVELDPDDVVSQYTLGTSAGRMTEEAGLFGKVGYANTCKDAFRKAVELDPKHFPSRVGLAMYYCFAPGIVGGSWSRAYEQAEAITRIPGRADDGYAIIALIASEEGDWDRYNEAIDKALSVAESQEERDDIHADAAYVMLNNREDPRRALEHLEQITSKSIMSTTSYTFVKARAHQQVGEYEQAIPWYERTIEIRPEAQNSPFLLGECAMEAGDYAKAREAFRTYLDANPGGEHRTRARRLLREAERELR